MGYIKSSTHQQKLLRKADQGDICGHSYFDNRRRKHFICENKPMDNGKCRKHGGKALKGIDHGRFKHGKYSKYMPTNLLEKYEEFLESDELKNLDSDIALIESRVASLVENYDENMVSSNDIREIRRMYKSWQNSSGDSRQKKQTMFEEKLEDIQRDHNFWKELTDIIDKKRKLVKAEAQKKKLLDQFLPIDTVILLFHNLTHIVEDELNKIDGAVMDEDARSKCLEQIGKRFNKVINKKKE